MCGEWIKTKKKKVKTARWQKGDEDGGNEDWNHNLVVIKRRGGKEKKERKNGMKLSFNFVLIMFFFCFVN